METKLSLMLRKSSLISRPKTFSSGFLESRKWEQLSVTSKTPLNNAKPPRKTSKSSKKWLKFWRTQKKLAVQIFKDIKLYDEDIIGQIKTAVTDYQSENWYDMGFQLGEAGAIALFGEQTNEIKAEIPSKLEKRDLAELLTGFYEGVGVTETYDGDAIIMCVLGELVIADYLAVIAYFIYDGVQHTNR